MDEHQIVTRLLPIALLAQHVLQPIMLPRPHIRKLPAPQATVE